MKQTPDIKNKLAPINTWFILDKPPGLSSNAALGRVKRLVGMRKAGHAGTLDPMATGVLPIALGEATKTVSFVQADRKEYVFTIQWGARTDTGDQEGTVVETSAQRPARTAVEAALPHFLGEIMQTPPIYSAIKVQGRRAYDLARQGETPDLAPRPVMIHELEVLDWIDTDHASLRMACGKGTYVRQLAEDLATHVGTVGHVTELRRTKVGKITEKQAISLDFLEKLMYSSPSQQQIENCFLSIPTVLDDIPVLTVSVEEAGVLQSGGFLSLHRKADAERLGALSTDQTLLALEGTRPVALCHLDKGMVKPSRVLNV